MWKNLELYLWYKDQCGNGLELLVRVSLSFCSRHASDEGDKSNSNEKSAEIKSGQLAMLGEVGMGNKSKKAEPSLD